MKNSILENNTLIAKYLGWKYILFNDLQGFPKPGWYAPNRTSVFPVKEGYSTKIGSVYYKYVTRKHDQLRFYNSLTELIPVINKIENETAYTFAIFRTYTLVSYQGKEVFRVSKGEWNRNAFECVVEIIKIINERD